jgi:hypothetical protein
MDGTFVKAIAEQVREPGVLEVNGKGVLMAPTDWKELVPAMPPLCDAVEVSTLSGVRDFVKENRDALMLNKCILTVAPCGLSLLGPMDAATRRRETFLVANAKGSAFSFGAWHGMEQFIIAMQTMFVKSDERDAFLTFVSSVTMEGIRSSDDDGFSQEVTTKRGIHIKDRAKMPSPIRLAPYRAFREVEQVVSDFVVRVREGREGPEFALFEADGGTWQVEAVKRVAAWLRENVAEVAVIE